MRGRRAAMAAAAVVGLALGLPAALGPRPAGASAPVLPVTTWPCAPVAGACTADPTALTASWADQQGVTGIQIEWDGVGRPTAAPAPASGSVALGVGAGRCALSGPSTSCTWTWPSGLAHDGTFLDGTYLVTACAGVVGATCAPSDASRAAVVAVAVAPPPPAGPTASVSGDEVRLAWAPASLPDAAGYSVQRDGTPIWTCYLLGAGPPGAPACADPPALTDRPGPGTWSYLVVALRLGADPGGSTLVGSAPSATVTATVTAVTTTTGPGGTGPATTLPLPPIVSGVTLPPAVGGAPPSTPTGSVPTGGAPTGTGPARTTTTALPGSTPPTSGAPNPSGGVTTPTTPGGIRYPSGVRHRTHVHRAPALAAGVGHGGSGKSRPVVPAVIAAALLLFAVVTQARYRRRAPARPTRRG